MMNRIATSTTMRTRRFALLLFAAMVLALAPAAVSATAIDGTSTGTDRSALVAQDGEETPAADGEGEEAPAEEEPAAADEDNDDNESGIITLAVVMLVVSLVVGAGVGLYGLTEK